MEVRSPNLLVGVTWVGGQKSEPGGRGDTWVGWLEDEPGGRGDTWVGKIPFQPSNVKLLTTVSSSRMPVRTRNGQRYKQWMLDQKIGSCDGVLDPDYCCDVDENGCGSPDPTLTGFAMRVFERVSCMCMACGGTTDDGCKRILFIAGECVKANLPSPSVARSSRDRNPRIRLLEDLGLKGTLPYEQRPWVADLLSCETNRLYYALPALTDPGVDPEREWETLEDLETVDALEALHPRLSSVDGLPCCRNGCDNDPCECQPCPLCDGRYPAWVLTFNDQTLKNGQWVGPHCMTCDVTLFNEGMSSRFTPEWDARGFLMSDVEELPTQ